MTVADVLLVAESVFEHETLAREWFLEPNADLGGSLPYNLLGTYEGCDRLHKLLINMQFGIYSASGNKQ